MHRIGKIALLILGTCAASRGQAVPENPFKVISERNVFQLLPPPKPPEAPPAVKEPINVKLSGISLIGGVKTAYLTVTPKDPKEVPQYLSLQDGQGSAGVILHGIFDDRDEVKILRDGEEVVLGLDKTPTSGPAGPGLPQPGPPGFPAPPAFRPGVAPAVGVPTAGISSPFSPQNTGSVIAGGNPTPAVNTIYTQASPASQSVIAGGPATIQANGGMTTLSMDGTRNIPTRSLRLSPIASENLAPTPQQTQAQLADQMITIEVNRAAAQKAAAAGRAPASLPSIFPPTPISQQQQ